MTVPWQCMVATGPDICILEKVGFAHGLLSSAKYLIFTGIWIINYFTWLSLP